MLDHTYDFTVMDLNQDGFLDAIEVKEFYGKRGIYFSNEDLSAFFIAADKDEDGLINKEEYIYTSLLYDNHALDLNDYKFR